MVKMDCLNICYSCFLNLFKLGLFCFTDAGMLPVCLPFQVKQQHIDYNNKFLVEELQVVDKREAKDRVFFVSAREALVSRLQNDTGIPTPGNRGAGVGGGGGG